MATKWEYLFVNVELLKDRWLVRWINDGEVADWKDGLDRDLANDLGEEGWELVGMGGPGAVMATTSSRGQNPDLSVPIDPPRRYNHE